MRRAIRPSSSAHGSPSGGAGMSTSRRRPHPGSIRSNVSSRSCRNSRSNVACIDRLPSWKLRSTPISRPVTPIQNRSDGPNLPTTSSHRSSASAAEQSAITKQLHRNFRIRTLPTGLCQAAQTHGVLLSLEELMAATLAPPSIGVNHRYGCFSFFAARAAAPAVSFSHMYVPFLRFP